MPEDVFTLSRFETRVGATFKLIDERLPTLDLELVSATDLSRPEHPVGQRVPFSLIFHGPLEPVLPQRIYRLRDDELEDLDIFIVPVGLEGHAMKYEAIFT